MFVYHYLFQKFRPEVNKILKCGSNTSNKNFLKYYLLLKRLKTVCQKWWYD